MPLEKLLTIAACAVFSATVSADETVRWSVELPERQPMWRYVRDMQKDAGHPVATAGGLAFVGCEHNGALLALDAKTGEERWRFYTNGAIRTRPAADAQRVIFGSDDGYLYCLGHDGKLRWRSALGNGDRFVIGHQRLTSAWPVPTHPLLADGKVFALGGCWPADGVFMNAIDAMTGRLLWRSPSVHMRAMLIPHWIDHGKVHVRTYSGTGGKAQRFDIETGTAEPWPKGMKAPPQERVEFPGKGGLANVSESDGLIFGTGKDGTLFCAGPPLSVDSSVHGRAVAAPAGDSETAESIVSASEHREGYALIAGLKDGSIVEGLLRGSQLYVVAVDPDVAKVDRIRRDLDSRGCFDHHRLSILALELEPDVLPPYFASLVLSESGTRPSAVALESLRPYGGAAMEVAGGRWRAEIRGDLEGAGDWDHEYANAAMNNSTGDKVVRAPLGILWYGGPASDGKYYLSGNRPSSALISRGRMFIQGNGVIAGIDAYTGRLLWEAAIPDMHIFNGTHGGGGGGLGLKTKPWKHEKANAKGIPPIKRARATGLNWAVAPDCLYVFAAEECLRFDPATGESLPTWKMPLPEFKGETLCWGGPRIMGDVLVATAFRPQDLHDSHIGGAGNGGDWSGDRMPMSHMLAVDRESGELLWSQEANFGFGNRGFVATRDRAISIDLLQSDAVAAYIEEGRTIPDADPSLRAFDLKTGKQVWSKRLDRLVKYLSYREEDDMLLVSNRYGRHWSPEKGWFYPGLTKEQAKHKKERPNGVFRAFRARTGDQLWEISEQHYDGPFSVIGDLILNRYGTAFDPATGKLAERLSPLTGQAESFGFKKSGCAVLGGCENLVGWRTAYHDMSNGTTVKLPGFEAGCTTSLLPASGMLNLPNFGMFHLRARAAAVSMAHRPSARPWREFQLTKASKETPIRRIGFNFAAPGDRFADDGTLWVRAVRGLRNLELRMEPKDQLGYVVRGGDSHWIGGSAVEGAETIQLPTALDQNKNSKATGTYTIRLFFAEQPWVKPGERVFDVSLEGDTVLESFDIAKAGPDLIVKEFKNLEIKGMLDIALNPKAGKPLLSGVELVGTANTN